MSTAADRITMDALALPPESREILAYQLLRSLEGENEQTPEISDRWVAEINRRAAELAQGKTEPIPAEDVLREVREAIG